MSCVNRSHTWISQGTGVSLAISIPYCCGFVIFPIFSFSLDCFVTLQGTKILEDRELRFTFSHVSEGAPHQPTSCSVLKYTGAGEAPEWKDIEPGSVFGSDDFVMGTQVKQTSSRNFAKCGQISRPLRIQPSAEPQARCARRGSLILYYLSASRNLRHRSVG